MTADLTSDTSTATASAVGDVILDVRHLRTVFTAGAAPVTAVDDVSISARLGQTLGVVGESGSGKSVLARSIMGLVSPGSRVERSGEIVFDGTDLSALPRKKVRRLWGSEIAMVLQDPLTSLNPVKKIGAQVVETVRRHDPKLSKKQADARGVELLRSVGIPEPERRMKVYPHQMSGGMRQRVGIAIALAGNPRLLFADEPTTALDVTVQMQILDLLARQQRERRMTMVLVTHDLGVVATRTDHIVVMYAGQVVESAPTRSLFTDVKMPYTRALLDALPKLDQPSHTRLKAIPGHPPNLAAPPVGCRFAARCPAAQEKCHTTQPPLVASDDDAEHLYRCWFPVGTPEYEAARAETEARAAAKDEENVAAAAAAAHQLIEEPA
ncbi:ABC transporter ATP-binding protein [Microbacterium sp. NPDC056044]|uniref:ABC transporter ATP-binding protein n=1 Tax=Microbacterium sp. NPDC056044 TaxID=3345690 RepID=UPI0035D871CB